MSRKAQDVVVALSLGILLTFGVTGTVLAAGGTLPINAPWGGANLETGSDPPRVVVTYEVKASGSVPQSGVDAVHVGIQAWIDAINDRETLAGNTWAFDLVPFVSTSAAPSGARSPLFSHAGQHGNPPGQGGGGGGDTGDGKADIEIQLKKGGGLIAGMTRSTIDGDGFRVGASIKISGSFVGIGSAPATIQEITMHELGHALSLGHHSNEADLMGPSLPSEGFISPCDLDGFEEAHHWLTQDLAAVPPHPNHVTSIFCP